MAKDCLTEGNIPHCECAICLENFGEGDNFIKTDCYHYFHHACLVRYATAFLSSQQKEGEDPAPVHMLNQEEKVHVKEMPTAFETHARAFEVFHSKLRAQVFVDLSLRHLNSPQHPVVTIFVSVCLFDALIWTSLLYFSFFASTYLKKTSVSKPLSVLIPCPYSLFWFLFLLFFSFLNMNAFSYFPSSFQV